MSSSTKTLSALAKEQDRKSAEKLGLQNVGFPVDGEVAEGANQGVADSRAI